MISPLSQSQSQAQQAAEFSSSTHGHAMHAAGSHSFADIALVGLSVIIVVLVCVYTVKFLIKPKEKDLNHIKRRILRDESLGKGSRSQNGR